MTSAKLVIDRKRTGEVLTKSEITSFINAFVDSSIPDYQMSALAMAICCRGMNERETADLTEVMLRSGVSIDWPGVVTADKHSTGGVGDKVSFLTQPIVCACGISVPSLTGRALGITGGTADKLETIPGFRASLTMEEFKSVVAKVGMAMTVQTSEIAPADRKLYQLRDVTGTVASIPLITASILSKKLAEGADVLVFDVKCGRGAFMKTRQEAEELAASLVNGAKAFGRKADAVVSDMDDPLGYAVGNANEVAEALDVLGSPAFRSGRPPAADLKDISLDLAARMVSMSLDIPLAKAAELCVEKLEKGQALAKFEEMIAAQGGDLGKFGELLSSPTRRFKVQALKSGMVKGVDAYKIAVAALHLGAGREKAGDTIDPLAGILLSVKRGERVVAGDPLATIECSADPDRLESVASEVLAAFEF